MKSTIKKHLASTIVLPCTAVLVLASGCDQSQEAEMEAASTETMSEKDSTDKPMSSETPDTDMLSLSEQLAEKAAASATKFPQELRDAFKQGIDIVRESGIEKSAKQAGDLAVDGELTGWDGTPVKLSELWQEGPVVLMWYRGGWCPYCNIQLRAMQKSLDEITSVGARLVVLTPELPEKAKETAETNDLDIVALHDKDSQLAREYGILFDLPEAIVPIYRDKLKLSTFNGNDKMELPLSATYVIDTSGKITYSFLDADYKKRAEPAEVVEAVKAAASQK